jgi:Zn-dependent metalloprotease
MAVPSTTPRISLAAAVEAGAERASFVQGSTLASEGDLVVYAGGRSTRTVPRLAYDVRSDGLDDQTPSRFHVIVDANTGVALASWDDIKRGTGNGIYVGTVPIATRAGTHWSMRDEVGNYTTDLKGAVDESSTVPGITFTDADNTWGNGLATNHASAAVDAQYGARKTFDFFTAVLGRAGITDTGVGVRSRVHYGTSYAGSYWDGAQATYGDGAGNDHPVVELDLVGHELSHGVTESTAGLISTGEAGGLSEATSDIFGTSVEWYANNRVDRPDYLIGELVNIHGNRTPLRYLDRPSRDGVSRDCWSTRLGALATNRSSGPLNHWFYLASEGSGAKVINGVSYKSPTCDASRVTPVGRDKAVKIWYRTLSTYLTSSSTYAAAREGAIQATKDLYGAASPECAKIAASFTAIAVPPGPTTCGAAVRSKGGIGSR